MSEEWNTLKSGGECVTFWQSADGDNVPEPALTLRGYDPRMIEIRQEDNTILINIDSMPALFKAMRRLAK